MSRTEPPFRNNQDAALERVVHLQEENARLREALVRARGGSAPRARRRAARRRVLLVALAVASLTLLTTALFASRAAPVEAAPHVVVSLPSAASVAFVAPPPPSEPPFDMDVAQRAIASVDIQSCADSAVHYVDGFNEGVVTVTFHPAGGPTSATLRSPAFDGSATAGCILGRFQRLRVLAFSGAAPPLTRSFKMK